jgi:ABC-type lipoprotein release transport system permease subunit
LNGTGAILWRIAFRNVWRQRTKSFIVGFILFLCTGLVVAGNALVDAVDDGMAKSITQSVSGHLQVYSADAKDELALFGDQFAGMPDIGVIPDFGQLADVIRKVPNVKAVVPMGIDFAMGSSGNEMDRWLASLRDAVRNGDEALIARRRDEVRAVVERLYGELQNAKELAAEGGQYAEDLAKAKRAATPEFWAAFDQDRLGNLEWLENHIAPLEQQMDDIGLMFLGTDLDKFARNFDRFEIVDGERVPPGHHGFLFNKGFYEEAVKHRVARGLDYMKKQRDGGATFAGDADLRGRRDRLATEYRRILYELDKEAGEQLKKDLGEYLKEPDKDLADLIQDLLKVDDANFDERYAWFYAHVAPHIQLYSTPVGSTIPLKAYTKAGYSKSVNVKVYGTFRFKGLEDSDIGKTFNLVDLMTFRDLYGLMTPERRAEVQALRQEAGMKDVTRQDAEAALFGSPTTLEQKAEEKPIDEMAGVGHVERSDAGTTFDPAEIEKGVALNAAVVLEDPTKIVESKAAIEKALTDAGLKMRVVDWQKAAGMIGQLVTVARIVLIVIVALLLTVAMVIINNSMVIATMERVKEIGTMRAIGAGRGWVARLFVAETTMLGLVAGGFGAAFAATGVTITGRVGLSSFGNAFLQFLFGGPRLYPWVQASQLYWALGLILAFALVSTLYPAVLASRVSPREAMASDG